MKYQNVDLNTVFFNLGKIQNSRCLLIFTTFLLPYFLFYFSMEINILLIYRIILSFIIIPSCFIIFPLSNYFLHQISFICLIMLDLITFYSWFFIYKTYITNSKLFNSDNYSIYYLDSIMNLIYTCISPDVCIYLFLWHFCFFIFDRVFQKNIIFITFVYLNLILLHFMM